MWERGSGSSDRTGYLDHQGRVAQNHPGHPHYAFARKVVEADKVVLTSKLKTSKWERTEIVSGSMADEVNALKRRRGLNIIVFDATVARPPWNRWRDLFPSERLQLKFSVDKARSDTEVYAS
jgi:hypothetical protein